MSTDTRDDHLATDGADELWLELRRVAAVPPPTPQVLDAARAAVAAASRRDVHLVRLRRARRRRTRVLLVAAAVAGILLLGVVSFQVGGQRVGPDPAAAATLRRAAEATLAQSDPVVGPGQYLRVTRREMTWTYDSGDDGVLMGKDGRVAANQQLETRTVWIPADVRAPWTFSEGSEVLRNVSSDPRFVVRDRATTIARRPSWAAPGEQHLDLWDPAWYATLPREPRALVAALDEAIPGEGSGSDYDFAEKYSEVLRSPLAPAAVRAALFEALADAPGLRVRPDVRTLDGRSGIAIASSATGFAMVFDRDTGLLIGEAAGSGGFPDVPGRERDDPTYLSSVQVEVVDSVPDAPWDPVSQG